MKIAVVGAGAIGGYLGARLSRAGQDVTFIARNQNLAAICAHGFRLITEAGQEEVADQVRAVRSMAEAGVQDVVLLTVKSQQVRELLPDLKSLLAPHTLLVTMINGVPWWYFHRLTGPYQGMTLESVDPGGELSRQIDAGQIIGGIVYPAAELIAPGVVQVHEGNRFSIGELDGSRSERITTLSQALIKAGFKAPIARDIRSELWVKLWGNLSFNPISALTHATLEDICTDPLSRQLAAAMMREGQAVAEKLGVVFKVSLEHRINGAQAVGAHKTSMLLDVEAGRALELEALVGSVLELGRITDTPTPTIAAVHAAVHLLQATYRRQAAAVRVVPVG